MKFDLNRLTTLLKADTYDLLDGINKYWPNANVTIQTPRYAFIDNNSKVLAVVHLDTVNDMFVGWDNTRKAGKLDKVTVSAYHVGKDDTEITSIAHDDRLGLYYIMEVLPRLGIVVDVLLTTDEEVGNSSASEFIKDKDYNWMFMFDRHGFGNVVMYQYETKWAVNLLDDVGYTIQTGTFSDISVLDHLGCLGFNFGVGYLDEHSHHCRTRVSWMNVCINMFVDFWKANSETFMPYIPKPQPAWNHGFSGGKVHGYSKSPTTNKTTTSITPFQGTSWTHGKLTDERCSYCGVNLYEDETGTCVDCYDRGVIEMGTCKYCSLPFAAEDLNDLGICFDCAEFVDRLDESNDALGNGG